MIGRKKRTDSLEIDVLKNSFDQLEEDYARLRKEMQQIRSDAVKAPQTGSVEASLTPPSLSLREHREPVDNKAWKTPFDQMEAAVELLRGEVEQARSEVDGVRVMMSELKSLKGLSGDMQTMRDLFAELQEHVTSVPTMPTPPPLPPQKSSSYSAPPWVSTDWKLDPSLPSVKDMAGAGKEKEPDSLVRLAPHIEPLGNTVQRNLIERLSSAALDRYIDNDDLPLPSPKDRDDYHADEHLTYWLQGLGDYLLIRSLRQELAMRPATGYRLLDLGCSSGRVLRHFLTHEPDLQLYGADISPQSIAWMRRYLPPNLHVLRNSEHAHLPFEDGFFDVVYAGSVFTMQADCEEAWLLEVRRILKPGGMALLTFFSERTWPTMEAGHPLYDLLTQEEYQMETDEGPEAVAPELFSAEIPSQRVVFRQGSDTQVIHHTEYVKERWGGLFRLERTIERAHTVHEDGVLLIKR